ncbi:MAG TPA: hypothetical protein VHL80_11005 [Polyangia bacterium]|nr:hypothetical protein [Polyangia bacterium]
MFGRAALVGLVAVAACARSHADDLSTGPGPCTATPAATPIVNLGPDLRLRASCGASSASGAVASVSEAGSGALTFSASIAGDPTLRLEMTTFTTCAAVPPSIAIVVFEPPLSAAPADSFDAVVTIRSRAGEFPAGMVNVHAEVGAPTVEVDRPSVDFGDVPLGQRVFETIAFRNTSLDAVTILSPAAAGPFDYERPDDVIKPGATEMRLVSFSATTPGDHSSVAVFSATARPDVILPDGCVGAIEVSLHARAIDPDGGADAAEAPADAAPDAPG